MQSVLTIESSTIRLRYDLHNYLYMLQIHVQFLNTCIYMILFLHVQSIVYLVHLHNWTSLFSINMRVIFFVRNGLHSMSLSDVIQKSALLYRSGFMNFFLYIFNAVEMYEAQIHLFIFFFFWNTHNYTSTNQYKHTNSYSRISVLTTICKIYMHVITL